jgi:hypothetical protein
MKISSRLKAQGGPQITPIECYLFPLAALRRYAPEKWFEKFGEERYCQIFEKSAASFGWKSFRNIL